MAIESKDLLVAVKAYAPANPLPLDSREIYESLEAAQAYAKAANAYAGQTIKVLQGGKYETYVLNGEAGNYTLDKVGTDVSKVKNYVQVVETLPGEKEQGVIYINTTDKKGYIWTGSEDKVIFEDVTTLKQDVQAVKTDLEKYAKLEGATFTGVVTLAADPSQNLEAATKQYVDRLVSGVKGFTVGIVDNGSNPLPTEGYKVGQSFRVAEAGTYAGYKCEVGDLILVVKDYVAEGAGNSDFLVVQTNIDGAVTGTEASTDANIVVFDGITGKKIKDSSVSLASLQGAIGKAHEHANKAKLDTYTSTQEELLQSAAAAVDKKLEPINTALQGKVDTATLASYYTKEEVEGKLTPITTNLNTKVSLDQVKQEVSTRLGAIPEGTSVKDYVDKAVGSGGTDVAGQISQAKEEAIQQAKTYTDTALTIIDF